MVRIETSCLEYGDREMAEFDKESCTSDGTSSVFDEEKVQKLFQACDTNEDGYIDSNDLLAVCRDLNLEYSLDDLLNDLGADEHGRISYDEFLKRRLALKPEIEALQHSRRPHDSHEYLFPSSSTSLEGASGGKEKWEFDSGARDLSPEPNALQRLVEAAGGSVTTGNAANLLSLANKLHLAALASLRRDINSLTKELKAVTEQRDELL
ncbi:hypothetical protein AAG570_012676 [Ranatra chinensis]|uniref:EF-hand domain-containing protein n=1 Tax=Ranatra chinensis TaxID=642074 RepID=A0ABD0YR10_9HEMI